MSAEYDHIAGDYRLSKRLPFRECVEWYSYRRLIGDVSGQKILDLACGEGFYSRRVSALGAAKVVGVDISTVMIERAWQQEAERPFWPAPFWQALDAGSDGMIHRLVATASARASHSERAAALLL